MSNIIIRLSGRYLPQKTLWHWHLWHGQPFQGSSPCQTVQASPLDGSPPARLGPWLQLWETDCCSRLVLHCWWSSSCCHAQNSAHTATKLRDKTEHHKRILQGLWRLIRSSLSVFVTEHLLTSQSNPITFTLSHVTSLAHQFKHLCIEKSGNQLVLWRQVLSRDHEGEEGSCALTDKKMIFCTFCCLQKTTRGTFVREEPLAELHGAVVSISQKISRDTDIH